MKSLRLVHCLPALTWVLACGPTVGACPFCDGGASGTNPVGEVIFGDDFWRNVCCSALPFAVLLAITALVYVAPSPRQDPPAMRRGDGGGRAAVAGPRNGAGPGLPARAKRGVLSWTSA